jgi:hypothetical protein
LEEYGKIYGTIKAIDNPQEDGMKDRIHNSKKTAAGNVWRIQGVQGRTWIYKFLPSHFPIAQRGASATQILYADSKHGLPTPLNMQRFALDGTSTTNKSTESRIEEWIAYMQIHNNNPPKGHKIDVKQHDDSKPVGLGTFCFQGIFWLVIITKVSVTSIENNDCKIKGWETSSADLWPQLLSGYVANYPEDALRSKEDRDEVARWLPQRLCHCRNSFEARC